MGPIKLLLTVGGVRACVCARTCLCGYARVRACVRAHVCVCSHGGGREGLSDLTLEDLGRWVHGRTTLVGGARVACACAKVTPSARQEYKATGSHWRRCQYQSTCAGSIDYCQYLSVPKAPCPHPHPAASRFNEQPVLPFNAYGTMALARSEFETNDASSQFFWLLKVGGRGGCMLPAQNKWVLKMRDRGTRRLLRLHCGLVAC